MSPRNNQIDKLKVIAKTELFRTLDAEVLNVFAEKLQRHRIFRNNYVFEQGDISDSLYIVAEGRVDMILYSEGGREFIISSLGPGDIFGEVGFFDGRPRMATAVANEESVLLKLYKSDFANLDKKISLAFWQNATNYACGFRRSYCSRMEEMTFLDLKERLGKKLIELGRGNAGENRPEEPIEICISQERLSQMLGASRERTNKALSGLERKGMIRNGRSLIEITDLDALIAYTREGDA